jgi:rhodanese-related sulfurtransferase
MKHSKMIKMIVAALAILLVAPAVVIARDVDAVVSADWLQKNLENQRLVVLDIRKVEDFKAGHIPGAVNVFFNSWAVKMGNLTAELPNLDDLSDLISDAGISANSLVVVVEGEGVDLLPAHPADTFNDTADETNRGRPRLQGRHQKEHRQHRIVPERPGGQCAQQDSRVDAHQQRDRKADPIIVAMKARNPGCRHKHQDSRPAAGVCT